MSKTIAKHLQIHNGIIMVTSLVNDLDNAIEYVTSNAEDMFLAMLAIGTAANIAHEACNGETKVYGKWLSKTFGSGKSATISRRTVKAYRDLASMGDYAVEWYVENGKCLTGAREIYNKIKAAKLADSKVDIVNHEVNRQAALQAEVEAAKAAKVAAKAKAEAEAKAAKVKTKAAKAKAEAEAAKAAEAEAEAEAAKAEAEAKAKAEAEAKAKAEEVVKKLTPKPSTTGTRNTIETPKGLNGYQDKVEELLIKYGDFMDGDAYSQAACLKMKNILIAGIQAMDGFIEKNEGKKAA